jgi:hypothetical protein
MFNYLPYESDEALESDEFLEYDESDESDEARRRRGKPPVRTAKRGGAVPQRPQPGFATRAELTATANRLDARIATNSTAIKTVEGRVSTLSSDSAKLRADLNKAQGGINDVRNMSMLLPLLTSQSTRSVTADGGVTGTDIKKGDKVVVDSGDSFSRILPLLLFSGSFGSSSGGSGGSGGSGSGSGGMFGGDSGGLMMVALMMAMQPKT